MRWVIFLVLAGCSGMQCESKVEESKNMFGEPKQEYTCSCQCPSQGVVEGAGILGGFFTWFSE